MNRTTGQATQPIDNRKDLLLLVLAAADAAPVVGVTRLEKYLYRSPQIPLYMRLQAAWGQRRGN